LKRYFMSQICWAIGEGVVLITNAVPVIYSGFVLPSLADDR